jgi:mRNA-degrading endonuclease RelE of RelBE toxin-antitoxin system
MKGEITRQAKKDLTEVDKKSKSKVWEAIYKLKAGKISLGKLKGKIDTWKVKAGDYRIKVEFDKKNSVIYVRRVVLRKEAYRD